MIVHTDITQGTPEWHAIRAERITASESGPYILNTGKVADGAKQKLIDKKLAGWAGEYEIDFRNDAMKRGSALEPIAREQYRLMLGLPCVEVGFISHETLPLGCSPDDIVLSRELTADDNAATIARCLAGGAEIKAPQGNTAIRYLREKVLPEEYKFQVHHCMAITGAPWWDFFAFCPKVTQWTKTRDSWTCEEWQAGKIPSFYIRTYRDAFTEELRRGLEDLSAEYLRQRDWLESLNS